MVSTVVGVLRKTLGSVIVGYAVYQAFLLAGWKGIYHYKGALYWWSWPVFILIELAIIGLGLGLIVGWKPIKRIIRKE